ncbi:MAG TPA: hypothetical protein VFV52_00820 [Bacilli bacterium]|nr:hypothetical protein [Bacilli bacterium]
MTPTQMKQLSVLELDELYYRLHNEGATLQDLKAVRAVQESKLKELPKEERCRLRKEIFSRFAERLLSEDVRQMLGHHG